MNLEKPTLNSNNLITTPIIFQGKKIKINYEK